MESLGSWKLIKAGFWLGIGFIVPSIGVYIFGAYMIYSMPLLWQTAAAEDGLESVEQYMTDADKTGQVKIAQYHESKNGDQLLILGVIENTGNSSVSSINIEAELLDENEQMVYECAEYISKKVKAGEKENFQIKCGCSDQPAPEHASVSLRVVSASSY